MEISDEKLIELYLKKGDNGALNILVSRHLKAIYNFVRKHIGDKKEAEDLSQEIFLKAWKNLKKFDRQKKFTVWLFKIARNSCIDHLRRKKISVFSSLQKEGREIMGKIADSAESASEKAFRQDDKKETEKYLAGLSEDSRAVLLLYYGQEMTFQEIADLMGEPLDTVKSRHRRAILKLRETMEKGGFSLKNAPKTNT